MRVEAGVSPISLQHPMDVPVHEKHVFYSRKTKYCVCVVVLNEGERLKNQLARMRPFAGLADIVIADGRSSDGSTDREFLKSQGVRALLVTDENGLSTATRMGLAFAMEEGYEGIITLDGNGKDGVEAIPDFIRELESGHDLVQGSRFMKGGRHAHTPLDRYLAVRFIAAPVLALGCGYWYTDPTNAFRAMSMRFLRDPRVQPLRRIFVRFNLQLYFIFRAAGLGFKVKQIPVTRVYPGRGPVPTKIVNLKLKMLNFLEIVKTARGSYNPSGKYA